MPHIPSITTKEPGVASQHIGECAPHGPARGICSQWSDLGPLGVLRLASATVRAGRVRWRHRGTLALEGLFKLPVTGLPARAFYWSREYRWRPFRLNQAKFNCSGTRVHNLPLDVALPCRV